MELVHLKSEGIVLDVDKVIQYAEVEKQIAVALFQLNRQPFQFIVLNRIQTLTKVIHLHHVLSQQFIKLYLRQLGLLLKRLFFELILLESHCRRNIIYHDDQLGFPLYVDLVFL
jgi:hypothetical protein